MTSKWYVKPLRGEYASVAGVGDKYPGREVRTQQEENKASVGDRASLHLHAFLYLPLLWIFTELEHLLRHWSWLICPQNTCTHPIPFLYCTFLKSRVCVSSGHSNRSFHSDWYNWVCQAFSVRGQVVNFWLCRPKLLSQILCSKPQAVHKWMMMAVFQTTTTQQQTPLIYGHRNLNFI